MFATAASLLVRDYATYAKHSGIPEIKTVLGGFVIQRFMGAWTLLVKSIGLVRDDSISGRRSVNGHSVLQSLLDFGWAKKGRSSM